jgi:hypothetical protein
MLSVVVNRKIACGPLKCAEFYVLPWLSRQKLTKKLGRKGRSPWVDPRTRPAGDIGLSRTAARMVNGMSGQRAALTKTTELPSKPYSATIVADWIPVIATGAAFFIIVLDTSIVNLALARTTPVILQIDSHQILRADSRSRVNATAAYARSARRSRSRSRAPGGTERDAAARPAGTSRPATRHRRRAGRARGRGRCRARCRGR